MANEAKTQGDRPVIPDRELMNQKWPPGSPVFFEQLRSGRSITGACRQAGIPVRTQREWAARDPVFKRLQEEAIQEGSDILMDIAWQRATKGVERKEYRKTKSGEFVEVGSHFEPSDKLMVIMLQIRHPDKFRTAPVAEANVTVINSHYDLTKLSNDELEQFEQLARKAARVADVPAAEPGSDPGREGETTH